MVWLVFAGMTLVALGGLLWPLLRPRDTDAAAPRTGVAIYEAQLAEIDRDRIAGRASESDAQAARTEAARRLLAETHETQTPASSAPRRTVAAAIALACCVAAVGLYSRIGHPEMPDLPLLARAPPTDTKEFVGALAKIEAHLAQDPDDVRGWRVIAPVYLRMGRSADAVRAYDALLRLTGETAELRADHAEALVYAANAAVGPEAREEFARAVTLDPKLAKARYYLGLAAEQDGDKAKAREIWETLAAEQPPGSPLATGLTQRIAALDGNTLASDIANLPADAQSTAIRGMVEKLASRLQEKRDDLDGWLRLVRAYRVLKEDDKARAALADARQSFTDDKNAMTRIDALARELGMGG